MRRCYQTALRMRRRFIVQSGEYFGFSCSNCSTACRGCCSSVRNSVGESAPLPSCDCIANRVPGQGPILHLCYGAEVALPSKQFSSVFFRRLKVDLFKHLVLLPPGAGQNAAAVFDHAGMAAKIAGSVFRP
jgi:hypothetical protein